MKKSSEKQLKRIPPRIFCAVTALVISFLSASCAGFISGSPRSFNSVADKVLPSVVQLRVIDIKTQILPEGDDFPFSPWHFGPFNPDEEVPDRQDFESQGIGSGVIVRKEGDLYYVLTNEHVVGPAEEINVLMHDGTEYSGELVGSDSRKDLALIRFETDDPGIVPADIGDSDKLKIGDWVVAVGNPYGYESTVTAGIVSGIGRRGPAGNISDFIQTDAAINQGNSGGALVNTRGELVGINTWISTPTGGSIGLGFSIPVNNARKAIDDFITDGAVQYGWVGVSVGELLDEMRLSMNIPGNKEGAFVSHVFLDSPAYRAGLLPGDFITAIDETDIQDSNHLVLIVGDLYALETYNFTVIRQGETITFPLTVGLRETDDSISRRSALLWPGIGVYPITEGLSRELGMEEKPDGVFVGDIEPRTPFQLSGARFGDIITSINSRRVRNVLDFYTILNDKETERYDIEGIRDGTEISYSVEQK